ncbi:MAG TPA: trypsin-like peptidase domain-containing protein [Candidatus Paceibacterota bacterium]
MKNSLSKIFLIAVISILIFPQVSFAAWWNPFTWKIFNRAPQVKVQEIKELTEIEKLRSEVEELKKKTATPVSSPAKASAVVSDKSKATTKPVTPIAKPVVSATELKKENPQQYKTLVTENKTQLLEASKILSNKNIIARVKPSVVYIETASGSGSGIIISADGYVLTNAHVVSATNSATIKLASGASYNGTVVGRDENSDLALLKISASGLSPAFLGDSDSVEQGDPVFTFGYPLGIEGDVAFKDGTLSRRQKIDGTAYLEISAQILPGNSGGPLVNQAGEVIGINTLAIGALKVSGVLIGETLKFALPINVAKSLIPDLKNGRNVVIPKTPVITQEPAPTPPPQQPYVPPQTYVPPAQPIPPVYQPPPIVVPQVGSFTSSVEKTTSYLRSDGNWVYQFRVKFANKSGEIITWCYNDPDNPAGGGSSIGGMWYVGSDEVRVETGHTGENSCVFLMNPHRVNGTWDLDQNGTPKSDAVSSRTNFTLPASYPPFFFKKWGGNEPDENIPPAP